MYELENNKVIKSYYNVDTCLSESHRIANKCVKDLGQFPIQSAQILTACG